MVAVGKKTPQTTNAGQRKADSDGRQAASSQKGSHHQTWNHTQMQPLWQRLSLRLACLITSDAAQAKLTAWTDLPMVDPDWRGPTSTIT